MDNKLITEFFENPTITSEIYEFCMSIPEYRAASKAMHASTQKMIQKVGFEEYCEFERVVSAFHSWEAQAYYLFGLHLRRELCEAMMGD